MSESFELLVKGVLSLATAGLLARHPQWLEDSTPPRKRLWILAALSLLAYVNFGTLHAGRLVHHWESFHYVLGARYFPELGYDGIYAASLAAQRESHPHRPLPERVRDLRDNTLVPTEHLASHERRVRARFDRDRWQRFVRDHGHFLDAVGDDYMNRVRMDHGFNPSPPWIAVARGIIGDAPVDASTLRGFALFDLTLILALFAVTAAIFGARPTIFVATLFGLGFLHRFYWIGGAFLRLDWLFALGAALAAMHRRWWLLAGALLGYASAMRLFPLLFALGPLLVALRGARGGRPPAWLLPALGGFLLSSSALAVAGAQIAGGFEVYESFFAHIERHRQTWLDNNVGLRQIVVHLYHLAVTPIDEWTTTMYGSDWQQRLDSMREHAPFLFPIAALALLAPTVKAMLRAPLLVATLLGAVVVYAVAQPTCYYWALLCLIPLSRDARLTTFLFAMSGGLHLLQAVATKSGTYGVANWWLLLVFVEWIRRILAADPPAAAEDARGSGTPPPA